MDGWQPPSKPAVPLSPAASASSSLTKRLPMPTITEYFFLVAWVERHTRHFPRCVLKTFKLSGHMRLTVWQ